MKIYIAGKITGNDNYYEEFAKAEISPQLFRHITLNPAKTVAEIYGLEHHEYLHICYAMIDIAEAVAFLPNWKESKGAKLEKEYAVKNGKEIIYLEE